MLFNTKMLRDDIVQEQVFLLLRGHLKKKKTATSDYFDNAIYTVGPQEGLSAKWCEGNTWPLEQE